MRRVVVTGLGMVTPLACGVEQTWSGIKNGRGSIVKITDIDVDDMPCKIAARIPRGDGCNGTYNPNQWMHPSKQRKVGEFIVFAITAAAQALEDAGWHPKNEQDMIETGVIIGSGIGGIEEIYKTSLALHKNGPRHVSPFFVPASIINLASGEVAIKYGLKGPNHSVATACSSGTHAVVDAARLIANGEAKVMVAGGTEAPVNRLSLAGFSSCRALATSFNDDPSRASRPYDRDRAGFVIGEGAGVLVLEELEHAVNRNARIYAEIIGYGLSGDAFHITAPPKDGAGAYRSMKSAIIRANISVDEIDYINAHGTSTMADSLELMAVEKLFSERAAKSLAMSSTKSMTGHLLGAAGAVEIIFSILAIRDKIVPPTINLDTPIKDTHINLVSKIAEQCSVRTVLSNSFGFGGTNVSIVMRKFE